jgi:hypothetical protein
MATAAAGPWFAVLLAMVAVYSATAVFDDDAVAALSGDGEDKKFDPSIEPHRLKEVTAITDFQTMTKYIKKRMSEVTKQQLGQMERMRASKSETP